MSKNANASLSKSVKSLLQEAEKDEPSNKNDIEQLVADQKGTALAPTTPKKPYHAATRTATKRLSVPLDPHFHAQLKVFAAMNFTTIEEVVRDALKAWLEKG